MTKAGVTEEGKEQKAVEVKKPTFRSTVELLAAIGGALALIAMLYQGWIWFGQVGDVELPDAYAHEHWSSAGEEDMAWLVGNWHYPSLDPFISRFKIEDGALHQQNEGVRPEAFITEWVRCAVHVSDKGLLRLEYTGKPAWGVSFIEQTDRYVGHEFERSVLDNGTVETSDGRQMLNVDHCKTSADGFTYDCR